VIVSPPRAVSIFLPRASVADQQVKMFLWLLQQFAPATCVFFARFFRLLRHRL
jgi:hypothetical protein